MRTKNVWLLMLVIAMLSAMFAMGAVGCGDDDDDDDNDDDDDTTADDDDDNDDDATPDDDDDDNTPGDDDDDDTTPGDTEEPVITDTTDFGDTPDVTGPYTIETTVNDNVGVANVTLFYSVDGGAFLEVAMTMITKDGDYTGDIPGLAAGGDIDYYIFADDVAENEAMDPADAPATLYSFTVIVSVEEELFDDDGTLEDGWTLFYTYGPGSIMAKKLTPSTYPSYLSEIQVAVSTDGSGAVDYEVVIFADDTGGDPADATEIWTSGNITTIPSTFPAWDWSVHDVAMALETEDLIAGNWLIGVRYNSESLFFGTDRGFGSPDPNVVIYDATGSVWTDTVGLVSYDGTQMARATAYHY
jgi:hypothetical protein